MPDFHGPFQHVTLSGTLWLVLAYPAAAALFTIWRALYPRPADARAREAVAICSIGAVGLSFGMVGYHAWILSTKGDGERFLLQHLWRMVRVGQLDASFDLALDPLSATLALLVTAAALSVLVRAARTAGAASEASPAAYVRLFAWLNGFVVALLVLVLADNFVLLFFGWEGVALCGWGLLGLAWSSDARATSGRRSFLVARAGDVGLFLGAALLYWAFGGGWVDGGDYVPDLGARFSSVEVTSAAASPPAEDAPSPAGEDDDAEPTPRLPPTTGEGFLTLTSYSGAVVFMDDTRVPLQRGPGEILRAPFSRYPVKGGFHSFRIHPGGGLDDFLVTHVAFGGDREIALAAFGPAVTFRTLRDQLVARDGSGRAPVREALVAKRAWGRITAPALACFFFFVALLASALRVPLALSRPRGGEGRRAPVVAHMVVTAAAGVYLVARLWFVLALARPGSMALAAVCAALALLSFLVLIHLAPPVGAFLAELDARVIDALVSAGAIATRTTAWIAGRGDDAVVDGAFRLLATGVTRAGGRVQRVQSGRIQTYVLVFVLGVLALAFLPYWLR